MTTRTLPGAAPLAGAAPGGRSARLIHSYSADLERAGRVRFIREITDRTLSQTHYDRYLLIEREFVRTALRITGLCLWSETDSLRALHHAHSIAALAGEQLDYFDRALGDREIPGAAAVLARSAVLSEYALAAAERHGYAGVLTCMLAAETLYAGWCTRTAAGWEEGVSGPQAEWVRMHATPAFATQARLLGVMLDAQEISADGALGEVFRGMLAAEDSFHDSIYSSIKDTE